MFVLESVQIVFVYNKKHFIEMVNYHTTKNVKGLNML